MAELEEHLNKQLLALQQALSLHYGTMRMMKEYQVKGDGTSGILSSPQDDSENGLDTQRSRCKTWISAKAKENDSGAVGRLLSRMTQIQNGIGPKDLAADIASTSVQGNVHATSVPHADDSLKGPAQNADLETPLLAQACDELVLLSQAPANRKQKVYNHSFSKQDEVKSRMEELLAKAIVNVEDCYKETGLWQTLARSQKFQNVAMLAIILNCIWLAIDTDFDHATDISVAPLTFKVVDNLFCVVFSFEVAVRFLAFKQKASALRFASFLFDAALVGMMAWETWLMPVVSYVMGSSAPGGTAQRAATVLRIVRVFRLMRAARMARLLKNIPELMIMAKGMLAAMRATVSILSLLGIVIYIFAIAFTQLLAGSEIAVGKLDEVLQSMHFLLMTVLCGPDAEFLTALLKAGFCHYVLFIIYLLVAQLTIMNMLIGILCQIVTDTSQAERAQMDEEDLADMIRKLANRIDTDGDGTIDRDEFDEAMKDEEITCSLANMGVDLVSISDYASFIFSECGELSYSDFAHMLSQFLGSRTVTMKDIMDLRKYLVIEMSLASKEIEDEILEEEGSTLAKIEMNTRPATIE